MPLSQRLPKLPGFNNPFKKIYAVVNISKLHIFADGSKVNAASLVEAGLARPGEDVKILGTGDLKRKLTVEAHSFSLSARAAIEARGGSVTVLGEPRKIGPRRLAAKTAKRVPPPDAPEAPEPVAEKAEKPERPDRPDRPPKPPKGEKAPSGEAAPPDS